MPEFLSSLVSVITLHPLFGYFIVKSIHVEMFFSTIYESVKSLKLPFLVMPAIRMLFLILEVEGVYIFEIITFQCSSFVSEDSVFYIVFSQP
jgi:hypothetical protein